MKTIKYFFEFIIIKFFFFIFKIFGYKISSTIGEFLGKSFGPIFRSNNKILNNLEKSNVGSSNQERNKMISNMWGNYGRILSEYIFLNKFKNGELNDHIKINGLNNLDKIIKEKKPVVFISGHFNNFELMAMQIENYGVKVAAIYRPLNNFFLNGTMEIIRKEYICKNQIKKGRSGTRKILEEIKKDELTLIPAAQIDLGYTLLSSYSESGKTAMRFDKQSIQSRNLRLSLASVEELNNEKYKIWHENILNV